MQSHSNNSDARKAGMQVSRTNTLEDLPFQNCTGVAANTASTILLSLLFRITTFLNNELFSKSFINID